MKRSPSNRIEPGTAVLALPGWVRRALILLLVVGACEVPTEPGLLGGSDMTPHRCCDTSAVVVSAP